MKRQSRPGLLSVLLLVVLPAAVPAAQPEAAAPPFTIAAGFVGPVPSSDGKVLYQRVCQGCHMADGRGAKGAGAYPSLAGNPRIAAKAYPAMVVLQGLAAMPAFGMFLSDQQIAAVVNYLRTDFGNSAPDALTAGEVAGIRTAAAGSGANLQGR